ncbi:hypothetical protein AVEN_151067-1, partial [Araneus ventricosus]
IRSHPKSNHVEDKSKPTATKDQVKEAWRYNFLETRVTATEEGLNELSSIMDFIRDKILKSDARRKPGKLFLEAC